MAIKTDLRVKIFKIELGPGPYQFVHAESSGGLRFSIGRKSTELGPGKAREIYFFKNHHHFDVLFQFVYVYQDVFPNDNQDHMVYHQQDNIHHLVMDDDNNYM